MLCIVYILKSIPLVCVLDIYKFWSLYLYIPSTPIAKSDKEHSILKPWPKTRKIKL